MVLRRFLSEGSWIEAWLEEASSALAAAAERGQMTARLCLAGGTTPWPLYRALAATGDPGLALELWPSDERAVPAADPSRNGRNLALAFAGAAWAIPPALVPWPEGRGDGPCAAYEERLRAAWRGGPFFDLALLGLGADGHTASLFPGDPALGEVKRLTAPARAPIEPRDRLTLTYPALALARRTLFAARGPEKLPLVRRLADEDPSLPASAAGGGERTILYCEV